MAVKQEKQLNDNEAAPVQVKGSDLCIVSLEVNKVEEVLWSLLIPLLPDTHTHIHSQDKHNDQAVSYNSQQSAVYNQHNKYCNFNRY